jgi:hypothetical protein
MSTPATWAAELAHVREVSLLGTVDLACWKDRLRQEALFPTERDGRAQILVSAVDARFWSVRLQELSFCVLVSRPAAGAPQDGASLVHACNSRRLFACCERAFFSTPYSHGDVGLSASCPAAMQLVEQGEVVFRAAMRADASPPGREPSRRGEDGWEGPVFLPERRPRRGCRGKVFFARISSYTQTYPFLHAEDSVTMRPSQDSTILQALIDSRFVANEWAVREESTHKKSKTDQRAKGLAARLTQA